METEAIVLANMPYKERDAILKVYTETGIVSVFARGVQGMKSKNRRLTQPWSLVRLIINEQRSRDMLFLERGTLDADWFHLNDDLLLQTGLAVLRDLLFKADSKTLFQPLKTQLALTNKDLSWNRPVWLLAQLMKEQGIAPNVDACAICGSTSGIVTLSLEEGGFLCRECSGVPAWKKDDLLRMRALFKAEETNLDALFDKYTYTVKDFVELAGWFDYHFDERLAALAFLRDLLGMKDRSQSEKPAGS